MGNRIRVGVLGTGNMGKNHLRVLSTLQSCQLVGCFDANREVAEKLAKEYGIELFESAEALYDAVDSVHVVLPSFLHKEYSVAAANAGCHVLVEKPIALDVGDAQEIIDACKQNNVRLCVGHVERFNPAIRALKGIIDDEELFSLDFRRMSPFYGRVSDASVVQDLMIHDLDVLNAIAGDARPVHVVSQGKQIYSDKLDYAQACIGFDNGLIASLTASRVTESKIRLLQISARSCFIDVDYLHRTVEISRKTNFTLDVGYPMQYKQENIVERVIVPICEPLRAEFEHFYDCIDSDAEIETSGEMGLRALDLCMRIQNGAMVV